MKRSTPQKNPSNTPSKKRPRTPSKTPSGTLDDCSICWGPMIKKDTYKTACNHIFHKDCICNWCEREPAHTCPFCRQNIPETCKKCKERNKKKKDKKMKLMKQDYTDVFGDLLDMRRLTPLPQQRGSTYGGCGKKTKKRKKTIKKKKKKRSTKRR